MKTDFITGQDDNGRDILTPGRVYGRKLHVLREENKWDGPIQPTDQSKDTGLWYEILAVGDKCVYFSDDDIGSSVYLLGYQAGKKIWSWQVGPAERIVREEWFEQAGGPPLMVVED